MHTLTIAPICYHASTCQLRAGPVQGAGVRPAAGAACTGCRPPQAQPPAPPRHGHARQEGADRDVRGGAGEGEAPLPPSVARSADCAGWPPILPSVPRCRLLQARAGATGGMEAKYEQQLLNKLFDLSGKTAYVTGAAQGAGGVGGRGAFEGQLQQLPLQLPFQQAISNPQPHSQVCAGMGSWIAMGMARCGADVALAGELPLPPPPRIAAAAALPLLVCCA